MSKLDSNRGFTLVELLVVIAIIGVLIGLLMPAAQMVREAARKTVCMNNLRQIGFALHQHNDSQGALPPGWKSGAEIGSPGWGWGTYILPFLEHQNLADKINMEINIEDPAYADVLKTNLEVYFCPSDLAQNKEVFSLEPDLSMDHKGGTAHLPMELSHSNYVGSRGHTFDTRDPPLDTCPNHYDYSNFEGGGVLYWNSRVRLVEVYDGTDHTLMVGERNSKEMSSTWTGVVHGAELPTWRVIAWSLEPPNRDDHPYAQFSSVHSGVTNFVMAGGSVHSIADDIDPEIFAAMGTRNFTEVFVSPF